jgi:hypothetical protein
MEQREEINDLYILMIRENDMTMKCNPTILNNYEKKTDPPFKNQRGKIYL